MSGTDALMAVFRDEATESLARLSRLLLELESSKEGAVERVREVFRLAHSLKGAASTVGRGDLTQVAHELESSLDKLRRGQIVASKALVDGALVVVDLLTEGLERPLTGEDIARAHRALASSADAAPGAPAVAAPAAGSQSLEELAEALLPRLGEAQRGPAGRSAMAALLAELHGRPETQGKPRAVAVLSAMRRVLQAPESGRDLERRRFEALVQAADLLQAELLDGATDEEARLVVEALAAVVEASPAVSPPPEGPAAVAAAVEMLRVPVTLLDSILYRVDELVATKLRLDHSRRTLEQLLALVDRGAAELGGRGVELHRRLEALRQELAEDVHVLGQLAQALQDEVRDVRMVQVGPLLEPFRRTARDAADALGKRVRLELQGEEVRVDKRLFDLAKEPLTHLVRNAVDHGLEDPRRRAAAGKDEVGTVQIVARSHESQLLLEVSDDGRGVDLEAVKAVARTRGLLAEGQALDEKEALDLIFQPGFSTSATTTTISGRGVGLDVVRTNVARLGGRVEVTTRVGVGTRFVMALPLTLAAAGGLFVRVGRVIYCLPLSAVEEVRVVDSAEVGASQGQLYAKLGGRVVPWAAMGEVLSGRPARPPERPTPCVVLAVGELRAALGVDELVGQQEVVVKGLAPGTPRLPLVEGATSLADGTLVTVLEPVALLGALPGMAVAEPTAAKEARRKVLVVDDTLTTRAMVASVLERAGYEVVVAPDGEAAWARLAQEPVRLVVSDVDMPVLDGLGLTRRLRATARLRALPVILLTSLGSVADKAQGAEAGATAYVVKTDFDPAAFLRLVAEVLGEEAP